jgi:hypothetical protein
VLHASTGKGDEDEGASGFAEQPDLQEGRVLLGFRADAVVGIEEHYVGAIKCPSFACSGRYRLTMKQRACRPDRRPLKRSNAALRQRRKPRVQFFIKHTPSRLVVPFEVPSIGAPIVSPARNTTRC